MALTFRAPIETAALSALGSRHTPEGADRALAHGKLRIGRLERHGDLG
jgi:hypothetical protein